MKLRELYIQDYRVLRNLRLSFERASNGQDGLATRKGYALDFLAGVNGTGKTTALQFIGRLFAGLYETDYFPEPFEIIYQIDGPGEEPQVVTITNIPDNTDDEDSDDGVSEGSASGLRYRIGDGEFATGKIPHNLLPGQVIIYTTGSEDEWQRNLYPSESGDDDVPPGTADVVDVVELPGHRPDLDIISDEEQPSPQDKKVFFIRREHLPMVALCGLIASVWDADADSEILKSVLDSVGLKTLTGFSLRVRAHKNLTHPAQMRSAERLKWAADRVIQSGGDQLLLFDMASQDQKRNDSAGNSLFTLTTDPLQLFRMIFALTEHRPYYDPPLQEVNLIFQRGEANGKQTVEETDQAAGTTKQSMLLLFDWLSDGERSFLARMALFALFRADDLLILLNEPEVHFNDVWKREIVRTLDQIMSGHASHALITTHSSIALSDVPADDILVLRRTGRHTTSDASQSPGIQTFGADPSDILVHVFGTLSPNGEHSRNFIRRKIGESTTAEDLNRLEDIVAPGYWRYRIQLEAHRLQRTLH